MNDDQSQPAQWFYFGPWAFSTRDAASLITQRPRQQVSLPVDTWANALGLTDIDDPERHTINLLGPTSHSLNRDHAMSADLTEPVILATLLVDGQPIPLLLDGVHRLYRAWREHIETLPCYVLSAAETEQIKHNRVIGGDSTPRHAS